MLTKLDRILFYRKTKHYCICFWQPGLSGASRGQHLWRAVLYSGTTLGYTWTMFEGHMSSAQSPGWLFIIEDYTTHLYVECSKPIQWIPMIPMISQLQAPGAFLLSQGCHRTPRECLCERRCFQRGAWKSTVCGSCGDDA